MVSWVEGGVKIWDVAAPAILVREAGGRFTDWSGGATPNDGNAIVSNGQVHELVLAALRD